MISFCGAYALRSASKHAVCDPWQKCSVVKLIRILDPADN